MEITDKAWLEYINKLSKIQSKTGALIREYIKKNGTDDMQRLIEFAYAVQEKYGAAASELACKTYDKIASSQNVNTLPAEPAVTQSYEQTTAAVKGAKLINEDTIVPVVERLTKQASADTMLKNGLRDGAEFAWIPSGDSCAFCITLASNGWQKASKKAVNGGHAQHIHANCDCNYCIRFDSSFNIKGYDPDRYLDMYNNADPYGKPEDKINALRRQAYKANKDKINTQKRIAYGKRKERALQRQLGFMYNGRKAFIPQSTTIDKPKTIAGKGSKISLRDAERLSKQHGRNPEDWSKRVGKIESDKYIFDIHWYENGTGKLYKIKIKYMKEK